MSKDFIDGFDIDSLDMWNSIGTDNEYELQFKKLSNKEVDIPKEIIINKSYIEQLRDNSILCVNNTDKQLKEYIKKEQYFKATEVRVAKIIHTNFIERLNKILRGEKPL